MTREHLDQLIDELKDDILILESMVRHAMIDAVKALRKKDKKKSKRVYKEDININQKRFEIESKTLTAIATQQPMATDLRVLSSVLEIVTELERIGDYAKGIAKINKMIGEKPILEPLHDLPEMAEIAVDMLQRAVKAFVDGDVKAARAIPNDDDKVDKIFNKIYLGLVEAMKNDPADVGLANHLQWAAHNIERAADRVTNICERTIFVETGSIYELEESDDEFPVDFDDET